MDVGGLAEVRTRYKRPENESCEFAPLKDTFWIIMWNWMAFHNTDINLNHAKVAVCSLIHGPGDLFNPYFIYSEILSPFI